ARLRWHAPGAVGTLQDRDLTERSGEGSAMAVTAERDITVTEAADADLGRKARRLRVPGSVGIYIGRALIVAAILGFWQISSGSLLPKYLMSSPSDVAQRLYDLFRTGTVWSDIGITTEELVLGFGAGVIGGVLVGVILGSWRLGAA